MSLRPSSGMSASGQKRTSNGRRTDRSLESQLFHSLSAILFLVYFHSGLWGELIVDINAL